jgi:demethylmenaquinone methyltransferase/2-methoxy-6-polyprenyl-1,4-benzoquinol methylase
LTKTLFKEFCLAKKEKMESIVKPYTPDESKKKQVEQMFDNIAPKYDFLNRFLSLGIDKYWRKIAIQQLVAAKPTQVLDIATGTADLAIECLKQVPDASIVGLDLSAQMLAMGDEKLKKLGLTEKIKLIQGDSENLPFEHNKFNAISVAYGVRNFENLERGLQEMYRVLAPSGKLVVLEFSRPRIFPLKQLFNFYFKNILPRIGNSTAKDKRAYTYLYESVQAFPDGEDFVQLLQKNGFKNCQCISLTFGICSVYTGEK